jgi:hypothetical protein
MTVLFAAIHESGSGTKRTWRDAHLEPATRPIAGISGRVMLFRKTASAGELRPKTGG